MSYTTGLPGQNDDEPARSWQASAPPPPPDEPPTAEEPEAAPEADAAPEPEAAPEPPAPDFLSSSGPQPTAAPEVPDDYMPPTSDGSGFTRDLPPALRPELALQELSFDVSNLSGDLQRLASLRLTSLSVTHRIVEGQLTVPSDSATAVQGVLDALTAEPAADTPTVSTEPTDWLDPAPVEAVEPVDPPFVERTEPEIIEVPASEDIDEVIDEADEDEDEIVFDLASLSIEERRHLTMRINGANISHLWEAGSDLVVSVQDAPTIETYLDEVRNPDGFADEELMSFDENDDVDDEEIYAAMSQLYVAADKLMQKPGDDATAGNFYLAADDVEGLPAPFGFDPRVWQQVLGLTDGIISALDADGDPDTIGGQARQLRELLVNYV